MAIQNLSSLNSILNNYDAKSWTKSAELDEFKNFSMDENLDATKVNKVNRTFSEFLSSSISDVNGLQQDANIAIQKLATGESKNIHETMLAVEKADIAFKTMNQIRSKVLDAYREIMRMQL